MSAELNAKSVSISESIQSSRANRKRQPANRLMKTIVSHRNNNQLKPRRLVLNSYSKGGVPHVFAPRSDNDARPKRKRKTFQQLEVLMHEWQRDQEFDTERIKALAQRTDLPHSKVYKWLWHRQKEARLGLGQDH